MQTCQKCGYPNSDEGRFCLTCGNALLPAPAAAVPPDQVHPSGKAIGSLICGILFLFFPAAIAAIVLGHMSLADIRRSAGRLSGNGIAVAGLVLGYFGAAMIPVLIIAAIAIPNLLRAKMAANEASAVGRLRTMTVASVTYSATYGNGFPPSLGSMGGAADAKDPSCDHALLIDSVLSNNGSGNSSEKTGYIFSYQPGSPVATAAPGCSSPGANDFTVTADPTTPGSTGMRHFFVDETGVIRVEENATATRHSRAIR